MTGLRDDRRAYDQLSVHSVVPGIRREEQANIISFRFMFAAVRQNKAIVRQGAARHDLPTNTLRRGAEARNQDRTLCDEALTHPFGAMPRHGRPGVPE